MKAPNNLNASAFTEAVQQERRRTKEGESEDPTLFFDDIERECIRAIEEEKARAALEGEGLYVLAVSPWFSSQPLLRALGQIADGAAILTNCDKESRAPSKVRRQAFERIAPVPGGFAAPVSLFRGRGRGRRKAILHSKFMVICRGPELRPVRCLLGSFNFSQNSNNLEVMLSSAQPPLCKELLNEFRRLTNSKNCFKLSL